MATKKKSSLSLIEAMPQSRLWLLFSGLCLLSLIGCQMAEEKAEPPPRASHTPFLDFECQVFGDEFPFDPISSTPPTSWRRMDTASKQKEMEERIFPVMSSIFRDHDPARYSSHESFNCQTCHGREATSKESFTAPSVLYPLDPQNLPQRNDPNPQIAKAVAFMEDQVVPRMSSLLGQDINCFHCHAEKKPYQMTAKTNAPQAQKNDLSSSNLNAPENLAQPTTPQETPFLCGASRILYNGVCHRLCDERKECPRGHRCVEAIHRWICLPHDYSAPTAP